MAHMRERINNWLLIVDISWTFSIFSVFSVFSVLFVSRDILVCVPLIFLRSGMFVLWNDRRLNYHGIRIPGFRDSAIPRFTTNERGNCLFSETIKAMILCRVDKQTKRDETRGERNEERGERKGERKKRKRTNSVFRCERNALFTLTALNWQFDGILRRRSRSGKIDRIGGTGGTNGSRISLASTLLNFSPLPPFFGP